MPCAIHAASGPSSTSHERSEFGCRWGCVRYMHASRFCSGAKTKRKSKEACRAPGFASPLPLLRSLLCAFYTSTRGEHTHAEHARHARTTRARLASHAHAPRGNTRSKAWLPCSSHWPLAARRPARRWHIWRECALQTRSPSPLRAPKHHRHAVHAINLHRCTLPPYAES